ncbi:carbohydrate sulfotransferase [Biomphalaria glabrata]|nr:hypothetical protein BgiMline_006848 [Biomphalaria glabrata]
MKIISNTLGEIGSLGNMKSCRSRCHQSEPAILHSSNGHCSCHALCLVYKTCCKDFPTECPLIHKESLKRFGHMLDLQVDCLEMAYTLAIVGCPQQKKYIKNRINQNSFSDIFTNTPVTDVATGLAFANMDIYNCNVPSKSNLTRKWNIFAALNYTYRDKNILKFEDFKITSPWYAAPIYENDTFWCIPNSISLCNDSILLNRECLSFLPYSLSKTVHNDSFCKNCSASKFNFESPGIPNVSVLPDTEMLHATSKPWIDAKCDMSPNATLRGADCHFVRCNHRFGVYLYNGTCRKFHLLFIAFQLDPSMFSDGQKEDVLNYIAFYLTTVLNINLLGTVRPLMSFYNEEIRQNMTVATFMFDFNSSALADFFYYTYRDGLSALAAQLRAYGLEIRMAFTSADLYVRD